MKAIRCVVTGLEIAMKLIDNPRYPEHFQLGILLRREDGTPLKREEVTELMRCRGGAIIRKACDA